MVHYISVHKNPSPDDDSPEQFANDEIISITRSLLDEIRKLNLQSGFVTPRLLDQAYALVGVG